MRGDKLVEREGERYAVHPGPAFQVTGGDAPAAAAPAAGAGYLLQAHAAENAPDTMVGEAVRGAAVGPRDGTGSVGDAVGGEYEFRGEIKVTFPGGGANGIINGVNGAAAEGADDQGGQVVGFEVGPLALILDGQGLDAVPE